MPTFFVVSLFEISLHLYFLSQKNHKYKHSYKTLSQDHHITLYVEVMANSFMSRILLLICLLAFPSFSQCRTLKRDAKAMEEIKKVVGWRVAYSWIGDDPCSTTSPWPGVTCEFLTNHYVVTQLELSGISIVGRFPIAATNLLALEKLDLHGNKLAGPIPPQIGRLKNLKILNLRWNKLQDFIPPEIGELKKLTHLYLSFNNLKGPIPKELSSLPELRYLYLQENRFSGRIPPEFGMLSNLRHLDLSNNHLVGTIRELMRTEDCFPSLRYLYLNHNYFTGGMPSQLSNLQNLEILYLSHNKYSGPVPSELASIPRLTYLYLDHNGFSGKLSDAFYSHPHLKEMYIEGTRFRTSVKPIGTHKTLEVSDSEFLF